MRNDFLGNRLTLKDNFFFYTFFLTTGWVSKANPPHQLPQEIFFFVGTKENLKDEPIHISLLSSSRTIERPGAMNLTSLSHHSMRHS